MRHLRANQAHLLTLLSLLSSGLGFLSQLALAKTFGVAVPVDAYFFSLGVPVFIGGLSASAINFFLTPRLRQRPASNAPLESPVSGHAVLRVGLLLNLGVAVVGAAALPLQWASLPSNSPIRLEPQLPVLLIGSWLFAGAMVHQSAIASLLVSRDKLLHAAILPSLPPLCSALLVLGAGHRFGIGTMLAGQLAGSLGAVALGTVLAGERWSSATRETDVQNLTKVVLKGLPHASMAIACFAAYPLIDSLLAPRAGPNVMSQISYAQRVVIGLGTLMVAAPLAMLANQFTDLAERGSLESFLRRFHKAAAANIGLALILTLLLIFCSELIVGLLFGRGRFNAESIHMVAMATSWMAPGMLLMLITSLAFRAGFALNGGAKALARVGVIWVLCYALLGLLLLGQGVVGLALAYSLTWVVTSLSAYLVIRRCAYSHFGSRKPFEARES